MANEQNLKPAAHKLTVEEQSKGGKNSGKSRRKKIELEETLTELLTVPLKSGKTDKIKNLEGIGNKNITVLQAMIIKQIEKAIKKGDTAAFKMLLDMAKETEPKDADGEAETNTKGNSFIDALNGKAAETWNEETNQ